MSTKSKLILTCCFIIFIVSACQSKEEMVQKRVEFIRINEERGSKIVQALNEYEQDHGTVPEQLEELVPTYLPEVPRTSNEEDFIYKMVKVSKSIRFSLYFRVEGTLSCGYNDPFKMWECSPGGD